MINKFFDTLNIEKGLPKLLMDQLFSDSDHHRPYSIEYIPPVFHHLRCGADPIVDCNLVLYGT